MDFTFRQIRYFMAVAETGQISKAALRCHITQSSMTTALRQLEEAVDAPLFVRHAKGLTLSDAGERFLRHAQQIQRAMRAAEDDMRAVPATLNGTMTLGVTDTISTYLMPTVLQAIARRFPDVTLRLIERERPEIEHGLLCGEIDLGLILVSNVALRDDLSGETLLRSPRRLWVAPGHPLANADDVALSRIVEEPFLLLDMDEHVATTQMYWQQHGLAPNLHFQSTSIEAIRSMVGMAVGVTILSDLVYRPWSLDGGRIVRRLISDAVPTMDVGLVWPTARPFPESLEPVRDFLRALLRETT